MIPHCLQLTMSRRAGQNKSEFYELIGSETLGSIIRIQSCSNEAIDVSKCSIQWYRLSSECSRREPIVVINSAFHSAYIFSSLSFETAKNSIFLSKKHD